MLLYSPFLSCLFSLVSSRQGGEGKGEEGRGREGKGGERRGQEGKGGEGRGREGNAENATKRMPERASFVGSIVPHILYQQQSGD